MDQRHSQQRELGSAAGPSSSSSLQIAAATAAAARRGRSASIGDSVAASSSSITIPSKYGSSGGSAGAGSSFSSSSAARSGDSEISAPASAHLRADLQLHTSHSNPYSSNFTRYQRSNSLKRAAAGRTIGVADLTTAPASSGSSGGTSSGSLARRPSDPPALNILSSSAGSNIILPASPPASLEYGNEGQLHQHQHQHQQKEGGGDIKEYLKSSEELAAAGKLPPSPPSSSSSHGSRKAWSIRAVGDSSQSGLLRDQQPRSSGESNRSYESLGSGGATNHKMLASASSGAGSSSGVAAGEDHNASASNSELDEEIGDSLGTLREKSSMNELGKGSSKGARRSHHGGSSRTRNPPPSKSTGSSPALSSVPKSEGAPVFGTGTGTGSGSGDRPSSSDGAYARGPRPMMNTVTRSNSSGSIPDLLGSAKTTTNGSSATGSSSPLINGAAAAAAAKPRRKLQPSIPTRKGSAPGVDGVNGSSGGAPSAQSILHAVNAYREAQQAKDGGSTQQQSEQEQQQQQMAGLGIIAPPASSSAAQESGSRTPIAARFQRSNWTSTYSSSSPTHPEGPDSSNSHSNDETMAAAAASEPTVSATEAKGTLQDSRKQTSVPTSLTRNGTISSSGSGGLSDDEDMSKFVDFSGAVERLNERDAARDPKAPRASQGSVEVVRKVSIEHVQNPRASLQAQISKSTSPSPTPTPAPAQQAEVAVVENNSSNGKLKNNNRLSALSRTTSISSVNTGYEEEEEEDVQLMTATKVGRGSAIASPALPATFRKGSVVRKQPPLAEAAAKLEGQYEVSSPATTTSSSNGGITPSSSSRQTFETAQHSLGSPFSNTIDSPALSSSSAFSAGKGFASNTATKSPSPGKQRKSPPTALHLQENTSDAFKRRGSGSTEKAYTNSPTQVPNSESFGSNLSGTLSPRSSASLASMPPTGPPSEPLPPLPMTPGGSRAAVINSPALPPLPPSASTDMSPRVIIQPETPPASRRRVQEEPSLPVPSLASQAVNSSAASRLPNSSSSGKIASSPVSAGESPAQSRRQSDTQAKDSRSSTAQQQPRSGLLESPAAASGSRNPTPTAARPPPISPSASFGQTSMASSGPVYGNLAGADSSRVSFAESASEMDMDRRRTDSVNSNLSVAVNSRRAEMEQDRFSGMLNRTEGLKRTESRFAGAYGGE